MKSARDKFLTEAMGEKWWSQWEQTGDSEGCGYWVSKNDFSTPDGFFKLWEWSQNKEWWYEFTGQVGWSWHVSIDLVNPNRFADAVYAYLNRRGKVKREALEEK